MHHFFLNSSCHLYLVPFQFLCSNFIAIFSCQIEHNSAFSNNLTLSKASLLFFTSILLVVTKTFAVQMQVWKCELVRHKFRPSHFFCLFVCFSNWSTFWELQLHIPSMLNLVFKLKVPYLISENINISVVIPPHIPAPSACAYVKYVVKWVYMSANICFVHARIAIFGACGHTSLFFWLWCDWACLYSLLYQSSLECLHRSLETIYVPVLSLPLGSENPEGSGIDLSLCPSFLAQSLARTRVASFI